MEESFNQDFCNELEYHLTRAFANSSDNRVKYLWCDGVAIPSVDSQLTKSNIAKTKSIVTIAWIGINGQGKYEMTIQFGQQSLDRYLNNLDLKDCLPQEQLADWVILDIENNTIEVQLR